MSRSCKKHCYSYMVCFQTKGPWKRDYNRLWRRLSKANLNKNYENEDIIFYTIDEIADVWSGPADGVARYNPYRQTDWWKSKFEWYRSVMMK
jgi:hypothetical protein